MDDYIINISNGDHFRTTEWRMTIDLRTLSDLAGKRVEDKEIEREEKSGKAATHPPQIRRISKRSLV